MFNYLLFTLIILASTNPFCKTETYQKQLDFLENFRTCKRDSANKQIFYYNSLGIREEHIFDQCFLFVGNQLVYRKDRLKYSHLYEIFDSTYLVISFKAGLSQASGPDYFERDSVILVDLSAVRSLRLHLKNKYFTRSKDFLKEKYHYHTKKELDKNPNQMYAIEDIDFLNKKITVFNTNHHTEELQLEDNSLPSLVE